MQMSSLYAVGKNREEDDGLDIEDALKINCTYIYTL